MKAKTGSYKFRMSGSGQLKFSGSANFILLHPFRNLSAHEFSFPFYGMTRVRDALKIQFRPLLGGGLEHVAFMPFFTHIEKKSSSGCVFMLYQDTTNSSEEAADMPPENCLVWPAPLAFACEVGPNGLIIWSDDVYITTVWIKNWAPVLYRTTPADGTTPEDEKNTALEFITSSGGTAEKIAVIDALEVTGADIQIHGQKTLSMCPSYEQLDLSSRGASQQERREKLIGLISRVARASLVSGLIFLVAAFALHLKDSQLSRIGAQNPGLLYEASFGERSMQPLSSAAGRLRSSRDGTTSEGSVTSLLRDMSSLWERLGSEPDITVETLRYGSDNTDILGTAKNNESIQRLRNLFEGLGYTPRTDNIQTVPGGDMRFNMNISKDDGK
jgi:hypothetical protein